MLVLLYQLCAASALIPTDWGTAIVTLIGKVNTTDFTAVNPRPIHLLSEVRKLFEWLVFPEFSGPGCAQWAQLHPAQAGFRNGFSCHSNILALEYQSGNANAKRDINVYMDLKAAYPSARPEQLDRTLKTAGAPSECAASYGASCRRELGFTWWSTATDWIR